MDGRKKEPGILPLYYSRAMQREKKLSHTFTKNENMECYICNVLRFYAI
jgi:hypothetical protein